MKLFAPLAALMLVTLASPESPAAPTSGTTRFVFDGNRVYAELAFLRPDGSLHKALAYVDMGTPSMSLKQELFEEMHLGPAHPLVFQVGAFPVTVPAALVTESHERPQRLGATMAEGILPAGVLKNYQIVLDYRERMLTFAQPGTMKSAGVPTPFHINEESGILAVDAIIDGRPYAITIDNGSAWTWFRQSVVREWLSEHPTWARGVGAVGPSNMMMVGDLEAAGLMARIPRLKVGSLTLEQVDVLGPGPTAAFPFELFDWYSKKNALPVLGWIVGNVLKAYRLMIDYPKRTLYWTKESGPDIHELDQVGLTLRAAGGEYFVAGVAMKDGRPAVPDVRSGDRLVQVGHLPLKGATWGAIFQAMHGFPGERRVLVLYRDGKVVTVSAAVTAF